MIGGVIIATRPVPIAQLRTGLDFVDVRITLRNTGTLDVVYGDHVFYEDFPVPGFASFSGARFGLGARTGGLNENHWVDDLRIETVLTPGLGIVGQPTTARVVEGTPATFAVQVNQAEGVAFQWHRDGEAIAGATEAAYTLEAAAFEDAGSEFHVVASGFGTELTSAAAGLEVMAPIISGMASTAAGFCY